MESPHIHQIWLPTRSVSKIKVYLTGTKIPGHWRRSQVWWQGWRLFRNNSTNVIDSDINLWGTCTLPKLANLKMMSLINLWVNMSACNKTIHGNNITTPGTDQQIFSTTAWRGRPLLPSLCYLFQRNPFSTFKCKPERQRGNICSICVHNVHFDKIPSLNGTTANATNFIKPAKSWEGRS